jgi:enoyl-CoA hydratase
MMTKIHYHLDEEIALVTIDDGKANAMDFVFFEEMGDSLDRARDDGAKTLIIEGRPGFFSGGLDTKLIPTLSPTELNHLAESLARTLLRVFSLPIPTIAVCNGHAVAGGAMLSFSCDLRFVVDGPFLIQMNEMLIGIPLPSWIMLIGRSAIPVRWLVETLLHARAYNPAEVVEKGLFHELIREGENPMEYARKQAERLDALSLSAYGKSKERMRDADIQQVMDLLRKELPFPQKAERP